MIIACIPVLCIAICCFTMMVQMISIMAKVNCSTTNTLRGVTTACDFLNVPFKTFAGLNDERKKQDNCRQ